MKNQKKGIAFKNFRRFQDFPMLEFGDITYMVGKNNSGKSTMVKALLLVMDYLQNQLSDTFSFDSKVLEDANIVTFGRAKNNTTNIPKINFELQLNEFNIYIEISGDDKKTKADVNSFTIEDNLKGIVIEINYTDGEVVIERNIIEDKTQPKTDKSVIILQLETRIKNLQHQLISEIKTNNNSKETIKLNLDIEKTKEKLKLAKKSIKKEVVDSNNYRLKYSLDAIFGDSHLEQNLSSDNYLSYIINRFVFLNDTESKKNKNQIKNQNDVFALSRNNNHLRKSIKRIKRAIKNQSFFYLGANPSKQSALFPLRAKDNALAQAIHEYHQLGIQSGDIEHAFVKYWMKEFEVGDDFEIDFYAGEAYEFHVFKNGNPNHLADKGMGSLQAMLLILRVASLIRKNKKENKTITLLIEEPELNLHPALQSKLTDFFHEVNKKYNFNFIIETHSEYMIRKSQVLVHKNEYDTKDSLNPNVFKTFYFRVDDSPYEMIYRKDGIFKNEFVKGFFDVSADLAFDIL